MSSVCMHTRSNFGHLDTVPFQACMVPARVYTVVSATASKRITIHSTTTMSTCQIRRKTELAHSSACTDRRMLDRHIPYSSCHCQISGHPIPTLSCSCVHVSKVVDLQGLSTLHWRLHGFAHAQEVETE